MNKDLKMLTEAYSRILKEGLSDAGIVTVKKWMAEFGEQKAAYKLISIAVEKKIGMELADLADTATVANHVEGIADLLISGDFQNAWDSAKDAAIEILDDEGFEGLSESKAGSGHGHRLLPKEKKAIHKKMAEVGLDGNGRFGNPSKAVSVLGGALKDVGFHLDMVHGDLILGDKGHRLLVFRRTGENVSPLEEHPEVINSRISFSWEKLGYDNEGHPKYEVLCYPS